MKLQELANWNVAGRGGYRNRPVFLTPNGTKVVRLGDGYYPVTRRDKCGRIGGSWDGKTTAKFGARGTAR